VRQGWTHLKFYPRLVDVLGALDRGECDAVLAVRLFGRHFIDQEKFTHITEADLDLEDMHYRLRLGVHHNAPALLAQLNDGLASIRADGTWDKIYEHWIGPIEPRRLRFKDVQAYLLPAALVLVAVLGALIVQRRLLRRLSLQAAALRESEERLTLVLKGSDDGFWDWDLRANRFTRSERWAAMLGYAPEEIRPDIEGGASLVHPDDRADYDAWQHRLNIGVTESYKIEYRMRTKSGEWRWILDRGKVVARAPDGTPLRMSGTHTDVTERKRTEETLLEQRELLARTAHLLEQTQAVAHIGGWEYDLRTHQLYWSDETFRIHETTPAGYQPTLDTAIEFYAPECRATMRAAIEQALKQGTPYDLEGSLITAQRRPIRVRSTGRAERHDGTIVKIYGAFQDITAEKLAEAEQKKMQLKMLETQKLESLGVLAGGIAHDFNNLLTVILANASFARQSTPDDPHLAPIEVAARRAADLCRQMLAYAGHGSLVVERLDLGQLVHDTARLLEVSISKKAALRVSLADNLPAIEGDASQLRQVVMNLVINGSEALGDAPGEICVTTRLGRPGVEPADAVHAFELPTGECVCLEVSDTGAGMSPATLARIFDPFFTTKFTGRGLGLAATIGIVRTHHGALTVQSAPGHGSTFRLFLPAAARLPEPAPEAAPPPAAPAAATLLVVDDEPAVLQTADALLRHHGYTTVLAADGIAAVREFKAAPDRFAGIMLDLTMPGLDGAEVLREIRALRPAARVLIMSGFSEADVLHRLRGLGKVILLNKPFTLATMLAKVGEALAR
jgi:PAS domain S-box-containing protein